MNAGGIEPRAGAVLQFPGVRSGPAWEGIAPNSPEEDAALPKFLLVGRLPGLTLSSAFLLAASRFRSWRVGSTSRSLGELARDAGLQLRTARTALKDLLSKGLLRRGDAFLYVVEEKVQELTEAARKEGLGTFKVLGSILAQPDLLPIDRLLLAAAHTGYCIRHRPGRPDYVLGIEDLAGDLGVSASTIRRRIAGPLMGRVSLCWLPGTDGRFRHVLVEGRRPVPDPEEGPSFGGPSATPAMQKRTVSCARMHDPPRAEMHAPLGMRAAPKCATLWESPWELPGNHAAQAAADAQALAAQADGPRDLLLEAEDRRTRVELAWAIRRWRCPPLQNPEQRLYCLTSTTFRRLITDDPVAREDLLHAILEVAGVFNRNPTQRRDLACQLAARCDRPGDLWTLAAFATLLQVEGKIGSLARAGECEGIAAAGYVLKRLQRDTSVAAIETRGERVWRRSRLAHLQLGEELSPTRLMELRVSQVLDLVARVVAAHSVNLRPHRHTVGRNECAVRERQRRDARTVFKQEASALAVEKDVAGLGHLFIKYIAAWGCTISDIADLLGVRWVAVRACIRAAEQASAPALARRPGRISVRTT